MSPSLLTKKLTMKEKLILFLTILIITTSCRKDGSSSNGDEISYEAKSTSGGFELITYLNATEDRTTLSNVANNWKVTFKNTAGKPRVLLIFASSDTTNSPGITLNIYLNGSIVKTAIVSESGFIQYDLN